MRKEWNGVTAKILVALIVGASGCQQAQTPPATPAPAAATPEPAKCSDCVPVTVENFPRAETDLYMKRVVDEQAKSVGRFYHFREPLPIDKQPVVRGNRDTLYSSAVFDLDAGPVMITLPESGKRFMTMQVFDEDEYTPMVVYGKGSYTLTKQKIGTRYSLIGVRILVNPEDPQDIQHVHALQDAIKVEQKSLGTFEVPKWDPASQTKVRDALVTLGSTLPDMKHAFGPKGQVDPVRYLIGAAAAWGGNPDKDAIYLNVTPKQNDGKVIYKLHVDKNVPVDGFWSISLYNAKGYYEKNPYNAYTLNNMTATKEADGSVEAGSMRYVSGFATTREPPELRWQIVHLGRTV
jgi:hypothetical protein